MVAEHARTKYSAIFVTFTALGKTGGPGLSSVFQLVKDFSLGPWNWRSYNAFSFIAVPAWITGLILVLFLFQDIQKQIIKQLTKIRVKSQMFSEAFKQLSRLNFQEVSQLKAEVANIQTYGVTEHFKNSGIKFAQSGMDIHAIEKIENDYIMQAKNVIFFSIITIEIYS